MTDPVTRDQLYEIAEVIERRPVLGYWPELRAHVDAAAIRQAADELDKYRMAVEKIRVATQSTPYIERIVADVQRRE